MVSGRFNTMTSLGPKHVLLERNEASKFLGANLDMDDIIITYDNNITVYDTAHKKVSKSWTIGRNQNFTVAAVCNAAETEYVTVIGDSIIKTFKDKDFEKGDKFTVNVPIYDIIAQPEVPVLVVFTNGIVLPLEKVLEDPNVIPASGPVSSPILMAQSILHNRIGFLVFEENQHFFVLVNVGEEGSLKISLQRDSLNLLHACCCQKDDISFLITLWDDGSMCKSAISTLTSNDPICFNSLTTIKATTQFKKRGITSLSQDMIALVSEKSEVLLVDVKYGVIHDTVKTSAEVQILTVGSYLLVVESGVVSACSFQPVPVTLSSVLGKQPADVTTLPCRLQWDGKQQKKTIPSTSEENLLHILLESSNLEERQKAWNRLWKAKSASKRQMFASSSVMVKLLKRLTSDKEPWDPTLLSKVICTDCIGARLCHDLFDIVLQKNDRDLLLLIFQHVKDIREIEIVRSLNEILSTSECSPDKDVLPLLNTIIKLPFTEARLREALRSLQFSKAIIFLNFLGDKLRKINLHSSSIDQIIAWICVVLDAHFAQIVVNSAAWEELMNLQETVTTQVELYRELSNIDVILTKLDRLIAAPRKMKHFDYKIEVMLI